MDLTIALRAAILAGGKDDEISAGGNNPIGKDELARFVGVVGERPRLEKVSLEDRVFVLTEQIKNKRLNDK